MSDLRLAWAPQGHILEALARVPGAEAVLREIAEPRPHALRPAGPDSWFVVGEAHLGPAEFAGRAGRVAAVAWLVDQSHGRRRLVVEGDGAVRRLARGIGLDFGRFPVGASASTQYHTIGLHLTRVAPQGFEILAPRSFAEALWQELAE